MTSFFLCVHILYLFPEATLSKKKEVGRLCELYLEAVSRYD